MLADILQRKILLYDKAGEEHYNIISALHKSVRNSDADAALYWLARMLEAGEDPLYIARRMVRMASEDIGLAEPGAGSIVDVTACPGTDTCKLGIASSRGLAGELRTRLAGWPVCGSMMWW